MPLLVFVPSRDTFTKQSYPIRYHIHLSSFEKRNDTFFSKRFKQNSCSRIKYYFFDGKKRSRVANRFISLLLLFERNEQTMGKAGTDKGSREEGEEEGEGERRRSKLGESDIFERSRTVSRRRRRRGREREREREDSLFSPRTFPTRTFSILWPAFVIVSTIKNGASLWKRYTRTASWPFLSRGPWREPYLTLLSRAILLRKPLEKKERRKKEKEKERGVA